MTKSIFSAYLLATNRGEGNTPSQAQPVLFSGARGERRYTLSNMAGSGMALRLRAFLNAGGSAPRIGSLPRLKTVPGQRVHDLVIHHLIGVIAVVGKDRDAGAAEMLQNCGSAGGAAALPVLTLAEDIQPVRSGLIDKCCQRVRLRQIGVIGQPHIRQYRQVQIADSHGEYPCCRACVVQRRRGCGSVCGGRVAERDDRRAGERIGTKQFFSGFSGTDSHVHSVPPILYSARYACRDIPLPGDSSSSVCSSLSYSQPQCTQIQYISMSDGRRRGRKRCGTCRSGTPACFSAPVHCA